MRRLFLVLLAALPGALSANVLLDANYITTQRGAAVELGKWYGYRQYGEGPGDAAFQTTLTASRNTRIPLLTVYSNPECHYCDGFTALLNTSACHDYLASKRMVLGYFKGGTEDSYYENADAATKSAYGHIVESGYPEMWPYYRLEWMRPDGTKANAIGTFGRDGTASNTLTLDEFKALVDGFLAGYDNKGEIGYAGGFFSVSDTDLSRLEAQAGMTEEVWVPLRRAQSSVADAVNQVVRWTWKELSGTVDVAWKSGDAEKFVRIGIPPEAAAGDEIELALEDASGQPARTAEKRTEAIHVIAPQETDQENPAWIGERTADELAWGEWTMDLDTATQKVAAAVANGTNAYTLALCGGELWCGDCKGTRKYLCDTPEFKEWARTNHVALVLIDIPSGATSPTMLSWDEYSNKGVDYGSGAYYLSRKGVDPDSARRIFDRNHDLCYSIWCKPYEGRTRVWVPTMVLLAGDGLPHGRLLGDRKYPNNPEYPSTDDYTLDTYMRRLDELLQLADDPTEWDNNDWSTTTLSLAAGGSPLSGEVSAVDGNSGDAKNAKVVDVAEVTGLFKNGVVEFKVSGDRSARMRLELIQAKAGESGATVMQGPSFVLSEEGSWTVTNRSEDAWTFLAVRGDDAAFFACNRPGDSVCGYMIESEVSLLCGEKAEELSVTRGTLKLVVEEGVIYRLSGVAFAVSDEEFETLGDSCYLAKKTGKAVLTISEDGVLTYQLGNPGVFSFAQAAVSVSERESFATLTVSRTGGSAGRAGVRISHVGGDAVSVQEDPERGRFSWPGDVDLEWPDGIATNQFVTFPVFNRSPRWEGDQTVVFALTTTVGKASAAEPTNCTVTILEKDIRSVGRLELSLDDTVFTEAGVACVRRGQSVDFSLLRVLGADGAVAATFEVSPDGGTVSPARADWEGDSADVLRPFVFTPDAKLAAGSVVTVRVVPRGGIPVLDGFDRFRIVILPDGAPAFAEGELSVSAVRQVACAAAAKIVGEGFAGYRAVRLDGELPPGVTARVEGGALRVGGVPARAGSYASNWRVDGVLADGSVLPGGTLPIRFDVGELADASRAVTEGESFPRPFETRTYTGFAVHETDGFLASVRLSADSSGRISMAVDDGVARSRLTSLSWAESGDDAVTAKASGDGLTATLTWTASGVSGVLGDGLPLSLFADDLPLCTVDDGVYVVDFEPVGPAGTGHAFLSVRVVNQSSGAVRAVYTGMLPDGRTFGGSGRLVGGTGDYACLPVVVRTASGTFRALLRVWACAADWRDDESRFWNGAYNHSVDAEGLVAWVRADGGGTLGLTAGGGFYRPGMDLGLVCADSDLLTADRVYALPLPWDGLAEAYGLARPADVLPDRFLHVEGGFVRLLSARRDVSSPTFLLNRSSGLFSGRFRALGGGGPQTVLYRGVLLPNWGESCDCGRGPRPGPFKPFGVGTAYVGGNPGTPGAKIAFEPVQRDTVP